MSYCTEISIVSHVCLFVKSGVMLQCLLNDAKLSEVPDWKVCFLSAKQGLKIRNFNISTFFIIVRCGTLPALIRWVCPELEQFRRFYFDANTIALLGVMIPKVM